MEYNVDNADAKITFIDVVLGFMQMKNADVYVTGSNSKMLSYDILTQFRDRGGEIRVYPLPFAEFYNEYKGDKRGRIIILMVVCRLLLHFNLREFKKGFQLTGSERTVKPDRENIRMLHRSKKCFQRLS